METRATSTLAAAEADGPASAAGSADSAGAAGSAGDDAWLDELAAAPRDGALTRVVRGPLRVPARMRRRGKAFAATTPGQIVAMMLVLTIMLLAAGFSMSQSMSQRNRALETVLDAAEPMSASAHLLSTSLLQADTVAAGGFVQAGPLTREDVAVYVASIDQAVTAAADIHAGAVEADTPLSRRIAQLVTEVVRDLPVYTGLNERAKVNQRMGNPVGVAYMSEASGIMRERMLVAAEEINELTRKVVADEMRRLSQPQWVPLSGLLAALVLLLAAQWWLWRIFRRRLNRGFLAATLAVVVAIAWVGVSNYQSWRSGSVEYASAAQPWEELTAARIDALETRTDETFALLRRQSVAQSAQGFDDMYGGVRAALQTAESYGGADEEVARAREHLDGWAAEHRELTTALNSGSYDQAARLLDTRDAGPQDASPYRQLDEDLSELITASREATRAYIDDSLDATRAVSAAVALLSVVAVACIWVGIRRRLGEYL